MANVLMDLSNRPLSREENGVSFEVRTPDGKTKIGELKISKGGLRWWPNKGRGEPHFSSWRDFDEFMRTKKRK